MTLGRDDAFLAALATIDARRHPRVRSMRGRVADDLRMRFPTFAQTRKAKDIASCSRVAVTCGDTDSVRPGSYFEIDGTREISTCDADRRLTWTERLSKWFSGPDDERYAVVVVRPAHITARPIGGGPPSQIWEG